MSKLFKAHISAVLVFFLALQSLVPQGFMPGNLAEGEHVLKVCPHQQPELYQLLSGQNPALSEHLVSSTDQAPDHNQLPQCDWGALNIEYACKSFLILLEFGVTRISREISFIPQSDPKDAFYLHHIRAPPALV